jgi:hypothetical protein
MEETDNNNREEIYSNAVRAGKRTYFFDVKSTRGGDYYLTITESKRRFNHDQGKYYYEKHKLFLYKEDFDKFKEGLDDTVGFIQKQKVSEVVETTTDAVESNNEQAEVKTEETKPEIVDETPVIEENNFTDVSFDDLGSEEKEEEK